MKLEDDELQGDILYFNYDEMTLTISLETRYAAFQAPANRLKPTSYIANQFQREKLTPGVENNDKQNVRQSLQRSLIIKVK